METTPVIRSVEEVPESAMRPVRPEEAQQAAQVQEARAESAKKQQTESSEATPRSLSEDDLEGITNKMNQVASLFNTTLNFSVDKPTGKTIIKVMDRQTDELIRQIPPENMLKLMSNMRDVMGMLLDVEI